MISGRLTCPKCAAVWSYDASDLRQHPRYRDAHTLRCRNRHCLEEFLVSVVEPTQGYFEIRQWAAKSSPIDGKLEYAPAREAAGWTTAAKGRR